MKKKSIANLSSSKLGKEQMLSAKGGQIPWDPNRYKTHLVISPLWLDTDKIFIELPVGVVLEP